MLTIILWLDPGPLPRPSTATWLDTLPVDSSSINRRATGSPWITRAGGGPERGALSTTEGCSPWPASLCGSPVPPKEHGLKVMAQEGGRSFPAACGQMRVGRPAGRWPDRRGTGVFPPPPAGEPIAPTPRGRGLRGSMGVPAPGRQRLGQRLAPSPRGGSPRTRLPTYADASRGGCGDTALAAPPRAGHVAAGHAMPRPPAGRVWARGSQEACARRAGGPPPRLGSGARAQAEPGGRALETGLGEDGDLGAPGTPGSAAPQDRGLGPGF